MVQEPATLINLELPAASSAAGPSTPAWLHKMTDAELKPALLESDDTPPAKKPRPTSS